MIRFLLLACAALFIGVLSSGCVDFGIDDEQYICRSQAECGDGFVCLRGPGCYCVCKPLGAEAELDCDDPQCQDVATTQ